MGGQVRGPPVAGHEGTTPPARPHPGLTLQNGGTRGGGSPLLAEPVYPVPLKSAAFSGCEILASPGVMKARRGHPGPRAGVGRLTVAPSSHGLLPWEDSGRPPRILSSPIPNTGTPFPRDPKPHPQPPSASGRRYCPGQPGARGLAAEPGGEQRPPPPRLRKSGEDGRARGDPSHLERLGALLPWEAALGTAAKVPRPPCLAHKIICFHVGDKHRVTGFEWRSQIWTPDHRHLLAGSPVPPFRSGAEGSLGTEAKGLDQSRGQANYLQLVGPQIAGWPRSS